MKTQITTITPRPVGRPAGGGDAPKRRSYAVKGRQIGQDYQPEGSGHFLSGRQKARLVILARDAARRQYIPDSGPDFDHWRHEEAIKAVGCRISEAQQRHWGDLLIHFQMLNGQSNEAFATAMHVQTNPHRVAMFKLRQELAKRGLDDGYAETICQSKYKCHLEAATASQVWSITFDLKSRPFCP